MFMCLFCCFACCVLYLLYFPSCFHPGDPVNTATTDKYNLLDVLLGVEELHFSTSTWILHQLSPLGAVSNVVSQVSSFVPTRKAWRRNSLQILCASIESYYFVHIHNIYIYICIYIYCDEFVGVNIFLQLYVGSSCLLPCLCFGLCTPWRRCVQATDRLETHYMLHPIGSLIAWIVGVGWATPETRRMFCMLRSQ